MAAHASAPLRSYMRLLLLASAPYVVDAFVTTADALGYPKFSFTWDFPENASDPSGFGGSLTYAVSNRFCDELLPHFGERSELAGFDFVNCKLLRAALNRAFHTWSDNHVHLSFTDVTHTCDMDAADVRADCGVEVLIDVTSDPKRNVGASGDKAAYVTHRSDWASAPDVLGRPLRSPSGIEHDTYVVQYADVFFSTEICWYLDSTFCSSFHGAGEGGFIAGSVLLFIV